MHVAAMRGACPRVLLSLASKTQNRGRFFSGNRRIWQAALSKKHTKQLKGLHSQFIITTQFEFFFIPLRVLRMDQDWPHAQPHRRARSIFTDIMGLSQSSNNSKILLPTFFAQTMGSDTSIEGLTLACGAHVLLPKDSHPWSRSHDPFPVNGLGMDELHYLWYQ